MPLKTPSSEEIHMSKDSKPQEGPLLRRFEDIPRDFPGDHKGGHLSDGAHRDEVTASWKGVCAQMERRDEPVTEPSKR